MEFPTKDNCSSAQNQNWSVDGITGGEARGETTEPFNPKLNSCLDLGRKRRGKIIACVFFISVHILQSQM